MLKCLKVKNLAIVEACEAEFADGLNVITGETGAGKSVLMGALELVLGGRADPAQIRDGAREAEVEAVFGDHVVRRTVTGQGRSRAWIDDESVSLAELKEFARGLVDIHGPRANQLLLEERFQRETLDAYGAVDSSAYAAEYARLSEVRASLSAILDEASEEELDFLRFQVNELREAELTEEDETLAERHAAAAHAEEIVSNANAITEALGGDRSAAELLVELQPRFREIARHLPAAADWATEVEDITIRIQELSRTVADAASRLDFGDEDLDALDARLTVVNRLKRKYLKGVGPSETEGDVARLLKILEEKQARLDGLENRESRLAELNRALAEAEAKTRAAGAALTKARKAAGERFARSVTKELHDLGFLQAKLSVALEKTEPEAHGMDRVVYLFEPNPGESARPLAAIASSGEIARVMLALKTVTASRSRSEQAAQTLVFDEIDANIGGEVGKIVGEKMRTVAKAHQVVAITHLPQSAVYGERHLVVSKAVSGGRTRTRISEVEGAARVAEIARMLGGEKLTSVVKRHAQELLEVSR